ncbi:MULTISPECIES: glycine cleavage system protein H [Ferrimicrobium]|uniref:glycine cleavage system protein H n=1 Tax=Ferrimicrobium TaxID=121038 RepID=UPI0023F272E5|nr:MULTISPECIES: glycine cleavage system protein H [Ferrimicrobium]MCL5052982.1 glycine cleavage system protein H [Gammaproteobacteria bacterium]
METWAGCALPTDRFYDLVADVWVKIEDSVARVGMTDVAQTRMGRLVQLSWKSPGRRVERGRPLAVLESAKWVGPMISPLTGVIRENNRVSFDADVAVANRDPYELGWLYVIEYSGDAELSELVSGDAAVEYYRELIDREGIQCFRCAE